MPHFALTPLRRLPAPPSTPVSPGRPVPPRSATLKKRFPKIFPHGQINDRALDRVAANINPDRAWKFVHVTDLDEIDRLITLRENAFSHKDIGGGRDTYDDVHTRYFALYYRDPRDTDWTLSKSLRAIRADDGLPIDLDLNVSPDRAPSEEGLSPMSSKHRDRMRQLMETFPKERQYQIGGFFSSSAADRSSSSSRGMLFDESFYRTIHGISRVMFECNARLTINTQNKNFSRWYYTFSGIPYHYVAGSKEQPYADYEGREAVALCTIYPMLQKGIQQLLDHPVVERLVSDDMYRIDKDPWQEKIPTRLHQEPASA